QMSGMAVDTCELAKQGKATQADCNSAIALAGISVAGAATGLLSQAANLTKVATTAEALGTATKIGTATRAVGTVMNASKAASTALKVVEISSDVVGAVTFGDMAARTCDEYFKAQAEGRESEATGLDCASTTAMALASGGKLMGAVGGQIAKNSLNAEQALKAEQGIQKGMTALHTVSADLFAASACSRVAGDLITNKGENTNLDTVSMCAMGLSGAVQTHNLIKPIEVKPIASSNNPVKPIDPTNLITNGLKWNGAEKRWENAAGQKVENLVPENKYVYDQRVNNWREVSSGKFVSEAVVLGEQALIMTNKSNLFWNMEKKVWVDESGKEVVHVVENYAYEEGKWKEVKTGQVVDEGVVRSAQINRLRELNEVVIGREIGVVEARLEKAKQETLAAYEAEKGLPVEQRVKHAEALKKYLALEAELKSLQAVKAENGVNNQEAAQRIAQAKEQEVIRQSDEVVKKQAEVNKIQEQIDAIVKENNLEKIDRRTSEGKKIAELEKQQAAIREEIEVIVAKGKQEAVAPVEPVAEAKKNIFEQIKEKVAPKKEVVEVVAVDQVSKLTTEAKEKAAKDAEVYEYDNRQKLIDQEKEILAKTESELARLTEGTETYLQKKAEVEASQVIIERLENLVEPANAAEIRQGRVAVRFGEWGKEIPKAEERIAILEKKEAELTRAANSRSENRTWWERLTGKSEIEVRVEFYKRQNELFKVKKQLALERSLAVRESELIKATDPIQIELLKGEIDRLMNLEEVRVRTGNESLDLTYEYLIREHETRMQKDGMAGNNNVFSIDSNQTLAFLKAMSTPDILLEFALAGGKTTVIGPLIMKANNLLYGRTGEFIAAEGQSSQAYKDMVRAMSKDIKIPNNVTAEEVAVIDRIEVRTLETVAKSLENKKYVAIESGAAKELERIIGDKNSTADQVRLAKEINKKISQGGVVIRDVVLVSSIGNDVIALRDRVKNASHVVTEASVPGFLETMVLNGSGTPEQLRAAREVLTKLRKDVAVFVDEAHLNFDPNKVFVQGNGEGKPISEGTKKNVEWLAGELTNLGIIKKGEMVDLSVTDINGRRLIEIKEGVSGFSRAGREVIAEKLAERLGVSKEIIIETFENGGRAKGTTEEVVRVLEVMNEYGRQLSMKKGSDFGLRENTEGGKKQNAVIAKDGVAQLEMQHGNEVTAAVFETIVSMVSGIEPNLGAINLTGKSAKAAFADHVAAIRADGNSSLAAGTGTIGRNRGTLESVYKLAVSESDLILEKFLGKRGDQGLIKESNILGVGRNEGTPDSFNTVLNRTIDQAVRIRDGAIGNRGNLEVVLGGKDIAPDVWVKRAAENREFINGSEHEFIYRNENGVWKQVKVDASGKIISTTEVSYEYAKGVLNNPKTKNTTVVIGEGGATGTNVLAENTVPGIDIISTQTGRDQLDQSAARIGRIKGSKQETFMLVIGAEENRIVTKTELRNIVNEVQVKLNQQNTYQAVSAAIEIAGTKVLKEIILNGEEGSVGVRVAREALAELQNAEGGRNLEVNQTSESPIEALQRQTAKIREIYLEISKTGKYKELFEYLEKNNPEMLAKVENNTKEIKLEFATETKAVAEGVLSSRDLVELAENFGKTITKDLLPEKISRAGKNAEEVIAEIMEQIKKEPAEVGMAEGQAERQVVAEEKISPAAKYAFENRATRLGIEGYKPGVETWGQFVNRVNVAAEERRKNPVEKQENNPVVVGNAAMMIQNKISEYKKQIEALGGVVEENASFNQLREKADQLIVTLERKASVKRNNNESVEDFKKRVDNILAQREADKKALIEEIRGVFKKYGIDLSPDGKPITEVRELDKIAQDLGDNLPKFEKGEKWPTYLARVKQKQQDLIALNKAKDEARKEFVQITLEENSELEKISEIGELNSWKEKVRARVAVLPNQKVVEENEVVAEKINPNQLTIEDARKALAVIRDKGKRLIVIFEKQVEGLTPEEKTALENVEREDQLTEIEAKRQQRIIDDRERLNQEAISLGTKRLNGES
ncbi:MAG TPA: hypothetical protein PK370_00660, partial [Candidatus Woesebacteria bacterium]|nr:hypothetical protein [Candidatus Woesebacteria bacterium]